MFGKAVTTTLVLLRLATGTGSLGLCKALARSDFTARSASKP